MTKIPSLLPESGVLVIQFIRPVTPGQEKKNIEKLIRKLLDEGDYKSVKLE